jgi:hypothetical protein
VPYQQQPSYRQFQEQVDVQRKQEMMEAQQAILQTGADNFSQQVRQIVIQLQNIQSDLQQSQSQLDIQMDAQRRQLQKNAQAIAQAQQQLTDIFAGGANRSMQ